MDGQRSIPDEVAGDGAGLQPFFEPTSALAQYVLAPGFGVVVLVAVGSLVAVLVAVGSSVALLVGLGVAVLVAVGSLVAVLVGFGVAVLVAVGSAMAVLVGFGVAVLMSVGSLVGVGGTAVTAVSSPGFAQATLKSNNPATNTTIRKRKV